MKKTTILLGTLAIAATAFGYKVKPEGTDLTKYEVTTFEKEIKDLRVAHDSLGTVFNTPNLGIYNFAELVKGDTVVGFVGLTHIKSYNKHEPLLVAFDSNGKILDMTVVIPETSKHPELKGTAYRDTFVGKTSKDSPMDILAGSTYSAYSINGEIRSLLNVFETNKDSIVKK